METHFERTPAQQPEARRKDTIKLPTEILALEEQDEFGANSTRLADASPADRDRYLEALKGAKEVGRNRILFWNLLVSTVERSGYKPPQDRQSVILDLACGRCEEGQVLSAFFGGGRYGHASDNARVIGVDRNARAILNAIRDYSIADFSTGKTEYILSPRFEFIVGDATNLDQINKFPDQVDVVVIRHEQISDDEGVWTKILRQALQRVSENGIIIITSFSDVEHEILTEALQKLDCEIVINERNPFAKKLGHEEVSLDRNVAIIRKKKTPEHEGNL